MLFRNLAAVCCVSLGLLLTGCNGQQPAPAPAPTDEPELGAPSDDPTTMEAEPEAGSAVNGNAGPVLPDPGE